MDSQLPETSNALIPLPKLTKKRRRELTNTQRAEIREFFFHDPISVTREILQQMAIKF